MTKQDFLDWKQHPVTKEIFSLLRQQEENIKEQLATSAGLDPAEDRYRAGYIAAYRDIYLIRPEDGEETND
jgi:hypothetical protein